MLNLSVPLQVTSSLPVSNRINCFISRIVPVLTNIDFWKAAKLALICATLQDSNCAQWVLHVIDSSTGQSRLSINVNSRQSSFSRWLDNGVIEIKNSSALTCGCQFPIEGHGCSKFACSQEGTVLLYEILLEPSVHQHIENLNRWGDRPFTIQRNLLSPRCLAQ